MNFKERFEEMLGCAGCSLVRPSVRFTSSASVSVAEMDFFDPILSELFARDFTFSEEREHEIHRTIWELLVNARFACHESPRKFIQLDSYIGARGFVSRIADEGRGFNSEKVIAERRGQLHLYDRTRVVANAVGRGEGCNGGGVGMYSLLTFADDFQYSEKGNEVAVRFDLGK
ncbi:MAG: ATP-binding protein [Nanoarchaeota archaeon]